MPITERPGVRVPVSLSSLPLSVLLAHGHVACRDEAQSANLVGTPLVLDASRAGQTVAEALSRERKTVRFWFQQFRHHLPENTAILEGRVQMDEAYFRGLSILMAKQTGQRSLAHEVLAKSSVDKNDAARFLFQHVAPRSRLQTDGSGIYKRIDRWWPVTHRKDIHKKWEFALTSEIEGLFGNLRTFIRRMYHHSTPAYLPEYVREFCFRFSSPEIFKSPHAYLLKTLSPVPSAT